MEKHSYPLSVTIGDDEDAFCSMNSQEAITTGSVNITYNNKLRRIHWNKPEEINTNTNTTKKII